GERRGGARQAERRRLRGGHRLSNAADDSAAGAIFVLTQGEGGARSPARTRRRERTGQGKNNVQHKGKKKTGIKEITRISGIQGHTRSNPFLRIPVNPFNP